MGFLQSQSVFVSPVLEELLAPAGDVTTQVANQSLLLVQRADVVLQVGQVVAAVVTVVTGEDGLGRVADQEMSPS